MRIFQILVGGLLLLHPAPALAQIIWDMPTEYPQGAMPGLGITTNLMDPERTRDRKQQRTEQHHRRNALEHGPQNNEGNGQSFHSYL